MRLGTLLLLAFPAVLAVKAMRDANVGKNLEFGIGGAKVRYKRKDPLNLFIDLDLKITNTKPVEVTVERVEGKVRYGTAVIGNYDIKDGLKIAASAVTLVATPVKVSLLGAARSILAAVSAQGPIEILVDTNITWNGVVLRFTEPYTIRK